MTTRADDTRHKIFDAAVELVARDGVAGASVQAILRRAGQKNGGAIHYHFGSLDGLWDAIVDTQHVILDDDRLAALRAVDTDEVTVRHLISIVVTSMVRCLDSELGRAFLAIQGDRAHRNDWRVDRPSRAMVIIRDALRLEVGSWEDRTVEIRARMAAQLLWQTVASLAASEASPSDVRTTADALIDAVVVLMEPADRSGASVSTNPLRSLREES